MIKEDMILCGILSLAVYFSALGVTIAMPFDQYYVLLVIIKMNAILLWTISVLDILGKDVTE